MTDLNDEFPDTSERGKSATESKVKQWREGVLVIQDLVPPTTPAAAKMAPLGPAGISLQDMEKFRSSTSQTGWRGVIMKGKKYRAQIRKNNENFILGSFDTVEEAAHAFVVEFTKYHS